MQPIAYKWELINVTSSTSIEIKAKLKGRRAARPTPASPATSRATSPTRGRTPRTTSPTCARNPALAGLPAVVAISDLIQVGGALISSFFSIISQPLNERSIGFNDKGVFLLRCFAQPVVDDDTVDEDHRQGHASR